MNSDNLEPADDRVPRWSFRLHAPGEPPPYQLGPRCDHGVPMAVACRECADPLTVGLAYPQPRRARRLLALLLSPLRGRGRGPRP